MTSKNTLLLGVAATVVAIAAFYFLALGPKRDEVATLDAAIAAKATELEQARMTLSTYEQARGTYKENYATLVRLGKAVPADDDVRSLLVQLEATADRSGVDFQKLEVGGGGGAAPAPGEAPAAAEGALAKAPGTVDVAGGALSAMPFNLTFNGGYFELQTFLARLERFVTVQNEQIDATGRLLRLESVKLAPAPAGFPEMRAEIAAASYLVPAPEAVVPAGAATATEIPAASAAVPPTTAATATGGA
jgi:Tfp pilus assembly protein PilO